MGYDQGNPEFSLGGKIDRLCDQFEAQLRTGEAPRVETFLQEAADGSERQALLTELLLLEMDYVQRQGKPRPSIEDYVQRFPDYADLVRDVLGKFRTLGEKPTKAMGEATTDKLGETLAMPSSSTPAPWSGDATLASPSGRDGDPDTRARAAGKFDSFLERAGDAPAVGRLGDYTLLEQLGQGGMGIVYRAIQRSADRLVALKVIRPDHLTALAPEHKQSMLERFRNEARAAARLNHENVVQVYDIEEEDGLPYYAMQYVEGEDLAEKARVRPCPNRDAARYLEPIARALQVAHQEGILHRDIKPQNILIEAGSERPKLTDFGLAKLLEGQVGMTMTGDLMGSPPYASPEQLRDPTQVDVCSDLYSFGATLYYLLTGRPPFQAATLPEIIRQINSDTPIHPMRLNPSVDRDLETICLKCLEKDPRRRYQSMEEVADELLRYLRNEPILARPLGRTGRFIRWARRNPVIASLAGTALSLILMVLVTFVVSYVQVRAALAREEDERKRAEENLAMAREVVEKFLIDVSEDPRMRARGLEKWRRELLALSGKFYDVFVSQNQSDELMHGERAEAYGRLAALSAKLGSVEESERLYELAIESLNSLGNKNQRHAILQARLLVELGTLYRDRVGYDAEASRTLQQAYRACEQLLEMDPVLPEAFNVMAAAHRSMAMIAFTSDRLEDAESHLLQAIALLGRRESDRDAATADELAKCQNNLALVYVELQYRAKAEDRFSAALKIWAPLAGSRPVPELQLNRARCLDNLGDLLARMGRTEEGRSRLDEALLIRRQLSETHPDVPEYRGELATGLLSLGGFHDAQGQWALAAEYYEEAQAISEDLTESYPEMLDVVATFAAASSNLGATFFQDRRLDDAEYQFRQAADAYERIEERGEPLLVPHLMALENLSRTYFETERWGDWLTVSERRLALRKRILEKSPELGATRIEMAELLINLARIYEANHEAIRATQRSNEAGRLLRELARKQQAEPRDLSRLALQLGDLHAMGENWPAATDWFQFASKQLARVPASDDPSMRQDLEKLQSQIQQRLDALKELE